MYIKIPTLVLTTLHKLQSQQLRGRPLKVVYVQLAAAQRLSSHWASLVTTRVEGPASRQTAAVKQRHSTKETN